MVAEPVNMSADGKAFCLTSSYWKTAAGDYAHNVERNQRTMIAEPIRIGTMPSPDGEMRGGKQ